MEKQELIELFEKLINKIYNNKHLTKELLNETELDVKKLNGLIEDNKFTREITLLIKTARLCKEENRCDNLKLAILTDLEQEVRKLKESIEEEKPIKL